MTARQKTRIAAAALFALLPLLRAYAQNAKQPFESQSASSIRYGGKSGEGTLEISNTAFEVTGDSVPGRPNGERLVLRSVTRTKRFVGDIGEEASTTVDAWPFGASLDQKPLYSVKVEGEDFHTTADELFVISRGLEEVEWWSVYKLGSGAHLFDTYVPLVQFSIKRDVQTLRYVGLEVPEDDAADKRLRDPHVVGVLTYASAERVIREVLITSDDVKQAAMLRSFADASRTVNLIEHAGAQSIEISIRQSYPSEPAPVRVTIPIAGDDLDAGHAQVPARLHVR